MKDTKFIMIWLTFLSIVVIGLGVIECGWLRQENKVRKQEIKDNIKNRKLTQETIIKLLKEHRHERHLNNKAIIN